jgi:glycerol-3-phosphate cytidylyltransferase-like family protein
VNFDTRGKIINLEQARTIAGHQPMNVLPRIAFITHLEVLRADHVRKLEQAAASGKLFIILTDPPHPLVPLEARAEIAAALRAVDYVIPSPGGAAPALDAIQPGVVIQDEQADRQRTLTLVDYVLSRS